VTFPFYEITVQLTVDEVVSTAVEGTDYEITGGNGSTGTVTFGAAPTTDASGLLIKRTTDRRQLTDYTENDAFPAETHEAALDRAYMVIQELDAILVDLVLNANEIVTSDDITEGEAHLFLTPTERSAIAGFGGQGTDTTDSPQFAGVNLGHASNTTLAQGTAAGIAAVEGKDLAFQEPPRSVKSGTSESLALTDKGKPVDMSNGSANTLTIPTNASVAFPVDTIIVVTQLGAGTTTIAGDTGVTLNGASAGSGDISGQYAGVTLRKIDTNTWIASGAIGAVS
jgi:hypothetical protein